MNAINEATTSMYKQDRTMIPTVYVHRQRDILAVLASAAPHYTSDTHLVQTTRHQAS